MRKAPNLRSPPMLLGSSMSHTRDKREPDSSNLESRSPKPSGQLDIQQSHRGNEPDMAAAVPTPSPFLASTRRFGFAPRLRSLLPAAAMSSAAVSASAPSPSSGTGEEAQAAPLPHSTLEIAGARRGLLSGFSSLRAPYRAFPVLASNRHVETIFAAFTRSLPAVKLRRECLRAPDDGAIALDWVSGDDRALPMDAPVLILLVRCSLPARVVARCSTDCTVHAGAVVRALLRVNDICD